MLGVWLTSSWRLLIMQSGQQTAYQISQPRELSHNRSRSLSANSHNNLCCFYTNNNVPIRSRFCTCYDSSVCWCANLWHAWIIRIITTGYRIFLKFQWWVHKPFVQCVHLTGCIGPVAQLLATGRATIWINYNIVYPNDTSVCVYSVTPLQLKWLCYIGLHYITHFYVFQGLTDWGLDKVVTMVPTILSHLFFFSVKIIIFWFNVTV